MWCKMPDFSASSSSEIFLLSVKLEDNIENSTVGVFIAPVADVVLLIVQVELISWVAQLWFDWISQAKVSVVVKNHKLAIAIIFVFVFFIKIILKYK